jgi:hypothetical protein
MLGLLLYVVVAFAGGLLLTFLWTMLRPLRPIEKMRSDNVFVLCLGIAFVGPFAYAEAATYLLGKNMESALGDAYWEYPLTGEIRYHKVLWYTGSKAYAIVVGTDDTHWGYVDRPIISVTLERAGEKWRVLDSALIVSDRFNKDGLVIPPYR